MLALLVFSVILWTSEAVDYAVSAVLISALMAFLLGLAPNASKPQELGFILPVNAPQNMVAYGTDTFAARDFVRTGLALSYAAVAGIADPLKEGPAAAR